MKLRMQGNSVRLRLKRGEVDQLVKVGFLREDIVFGVGREAGFHYTLEASDVISLPQAVLENRGIVVRVPTQTIREWALTEQVGIDSTQEIDGDASLRVLIEKDFACVDGPPEENIDTFPNPLAGAGGC